MSGQFLGAFIVLMIRAAHGSCECARLFLRYMALSHPVSVHLYFLSDQFQGYLVRHVATNHASTQPESLETWVTPRDHFTMANPPQPNNRLQHIQVSHTHTHTPSSEAGSHAIRLMSSCPSGRD